MLQPTIAQAAALLVTLLSCLALALTTRWHGRLSLDTSVGLQKFHLTPTPRIGGIATMAGLVAGHGVAPQSVRVLLGPLLVASLPAFCCGLLEDLTKKVGVRERLLGTILSGVLAWYITGAALSRTGVPGLDWLLSFAPVSVAFTAVSIGGVANAVNIIDGFNGLAGGVVSIMFVALGLIAAGQGDQALASACWVLAACSIGFTLVNWPFGKIFLGDGGAYQFGFAVGWVAVLLVMRNPAITAWAPLLVCAYPVLEVAFSVVRKCRRAGYSPGQPDRVHLHMLMHRRVVRHFLSSASGVWQNGMTSPFAWFYAVLLGVWAIVFAQHSVLLIAGLLAAAIAYAAIYTRLTQFHWWGVGRAPAGRVAYGSAPSARARPRVLTGTALAVRAPMAMAMAPLAVTPALALPDRRFSSFHGSRSNEFIAYSTREFGSSSSAVLVYTLLGLSTCVTVIEPAPFELIALPLVLYSWIRHLLAHSRLYTTASAGLVFLLGLFAVLQLFPVLLSAEDLLHAAQYAAITALLIMIGLHLGRLFATGDVRFRAFATGYCVAAVFSAGIAIGSLALGASLPEWLFYAGRPKALFKDPNVLGPYLVPAVLAFLYAGAQARSWRKPLYIACALFCTLGVIATASRGAWVNLALAVLVYSMLSRTRSGLTVVVIAIACLLGTLLVANSTLSASAPDLVELFAGRTHLQGYDADRFQAAEQAWQLGMRYPLGVGPGDITHHMGILTSMDPHNTFVRIWAENGPASLMLFLLLLAAASTGAVHAWFVTKGPARNTIALGLALLVAVLANASVVDALHWRHFWVILGLCVFSSHALRRN